jgi:hypothetical protein
MNTVKKISITLIRLLLVVLAPEFAFSQSVQRKLPDRTATNACSSNIQLKQVGKERHSTNEDTDECICCYVPRDRVSLVMRSHGPYECHVVCGQV